MGLVRAFAEFPLLPRLLQNINLQSNPRLRPDEWPEIFNEGGYNRDHIEEPDIPGNIELAEYMGADAWRLARRLRLVRDGGPTPTGRAISEFREGDDAHSVVYERLANAIRRFYTGNDGRPVVDRLEANARDMQAWEHGAWSGICPGLLLTEVEWTIETALVPFKHRPSLSDMRREVAATLHDPDPERQDDLDLRRFADALREHHRKLRDRSDYGKWKPMTLTESRASAMLLSEVGLFRLERPIGPVQHLVLPETPEPREPTTTSGRSRILLEDRYVWDTSLSPQDFARLLQQLLLHDFGANDREIFPALGIDIETRRRMDNLPTLSDPTTHQYRIINKGLTMELLMAGWLSLIDSPDLVVCHCDTRHGLPNRCAGPGKHDVEAHYSAPFHLLAEVSAKSEITRDDYRDQLAQALKHGRALAEKLDTTQPIYALVVNSARIDKDPQVKKVYRELIESEGHGPQNQVRVVPMVAGELAMALAEIHESIEPRRARFSTEVFQNILDTLHTRLLNFEEIRDGGWMLEAWREKVIEPIQTRSSGDLGPGR